MKSVEAEAAVQYGEAEGGLEQMFALFLQQFSALHETVACDPHAQHPRQNRQN